MELVLAVDAALDLAVADGLVDGRDAGQEIILLFLGLDAAVELLGDLWHQSREQYLPGAGGDFVAHQDPDLVQLLPLTIQSQQRADLEVAGGDVEGLRDLRPFAEVVADLPVCIAVVDDEEVAA